MRYFISLCRPALGQNEIYKTVEAESVYCAAGEGDHSRMLTYTVLSFFFHKPNANAAHMLQQQASVPAYLYMIRLLLLPHRLQNVTK